MPHPTMTAPTLDSHPGHGDAAGSHHGFIWHHRPCCTAANKDGTGYRRGPCAMHPEGSPRTAGWGQDGQRALHTHRQTTDRRIDPRKGGGGGGRAATPTPARHLLPPHTHKGNPSGPPTPRRTKRHPNSRTTLPLPPSSTPPHSGTGAPVPVGTHTLLQAQSHPPAPSLGGPGD